MNTKFNQTTKYTDYTDFLSQIASPQEPTNSADLNCVYEIQQEKKHNGCLRLGGCLPLRGAMEAAEGGANGQWLMAYGLML